jgi:nicotinamide riboside transporter PnuC
VSAIIERLKAHPRLVSWVVLAIGMVVILLLAVQGVALEPLQLLVLVITTIILAGLCVWIIGWEEGTADEPTKE